MSDLPRTVVHRFLDEVWHKGNLDAIEEFIAPDYIRHESQTESGKDVYGPDGARQTIALVRGAFPDIHFTLEDVLVDGDKVVVRWTCRATHLGPFFGIEPTGNRVTFTGINIYRVANGKIVERWANEDGLSLMQQLGTSTDS